jgi:MOSC domain-containing protein YiiM
VGLVPLGHTSQPLFLPVTNLRKGWSSLVPQTKRAGVVEAIHIAADAAAPVRRLESVRAVAALGLEGDRYAAGRGHYSPDHRVSRDLTLIEAEAIERLANEHAIELRPGEARRNITTRGVVLDELLGRRFWVGGALCLGTRLCEPCQYLNDLTGKPLLRLLVHRGGLRADILQSGSIGQGDSVSPVEEDEGFASRDLAGADAAFAR